MGAVCNVLPSGDRGDCQGVLLPTFTAVLSCGSVRTCSECISTGHGNTLHVDAACGDRNQPCCLTEDDIGFCTEELSTCFTNGGGDRNCVRALSSFWNCLLHATHVCYINNMPFRPSVCVRRTLFQQRSRDVTRRRHVQAAERRASVAARTLPGSRAARTTPCSVMLALAVRPVPLPLLVQHMLHAHAAAAATSGDTPPAFDVKHVAPRLALCNGCPSCTT